MKHFLTPEKQSSWLLMVGIVGLAIAMTVVFMVRADDKPQATKTADSTKTSQPSPTNMNTTDSNPSQQNDSPTAEELKAQMKKAELKKKLSPEQYCITMENGTETAFNNEYWNNHKAGLYVDLISGEPLFSSKDKFDSGTGWPSFTKPVDKDHVEVKEDKSYGMVRTEVRSKHGEAHLGHVFNDGPGPEGKRYCINSAALRFIPVEKLKEEGYEKYLPLFGK